MSFPRPPIPTQSRPPRLLAAALLSAALLATVFLAACGGGGGSPAPAPVASNDAAIATAQSGEVLAYVRRKLQARGPQGPGMGADMPLWLDTVVTATGSVSRSGTVVQEAGIDEDDLIKTDGRRIYTLQPLSGGGERKDAFAQLGVYTLDAAGRPQPSGMLPLVNAAAGRTLTRGMQLADGLPRLAVLAESADDIMSWPDCPPDMACITSLLAYQPTSPRVHLQLLDLTRADQPGTPERLQIDGRLVGSRQIGNMLYMVVSHTPSFAFDRLPVTASDAERAAALARLQVADVLPQISINGGPRLPLVGETDCWLQSANASTALAVTTITAIDLASPTWARSSRCFVGGTEALYMSTASLYLATSRQDVQTLQGRLLFAPEARTDIHKFNVSGASVSYRGSGSVNGHLGWDREKTSYRMSEHLGDLRVLSFTGRSGWLSAADASTQAASPATLTVLRENPADASLRTLATLPNAQRPASIGKPGEQVYAVRFTGDRGYVVTFRQTDPLYVLDLSNAADPRSVGELEVPGYSDWLFPIDGGLLFGVGKDADDRGFMQGVKVSLFDVRDPAQPRLLDSRNYGLAGSVSGLDYGPHGLSMRVLGNSTRIALPMLLTLDASEPPLQTLRLFEINSSTRSMVRSSLDLGTGWTDISATRSLLLGDQVHLLRDGKLQTWDW